MVKKKKTTEKDFREFKRGFNAIVELLGITDYEIRFTHKLCRGGNWATIVACDENKIAWVTLTTEYEAEDKDNFDPFYSGVHEGLHLLLCPLDDAGRSRFTSDVQMRSCEHGIIRRLEKIFLEMLR